MILWVIAAFLVLIFITLAVLYHQKTVREERDMMREVARYFGGNYVSSTEIPHHRIVVLNDGTRFYITLELDQSIDASGKVRKLVVSTDWRDIDLCFSVTPKSFSGNASAWFKGDLCKVDDEDFSKSFVVSSNQYKDRISQVIAGKAKSTIEYFANFAPVIQKEFEPANKSLEPSKLTFTEKSLLNRRLTIKIEAGKIEFALLVSLPSSESLSEAVDGMISLHGLLDANFIGVSKSNLPNKQF